MKNNLREEALSRVMIAAHRGVSGGNIPCNTISAFDAAINQGADIIELDAACSRDGKLFVFHPGMEPAHLCSDKYIRDMTADEISGLRYCNQDNTPTEHGVSAMDDVLEHLKGRCYINIDKFNENTELICETIRRHGMIDQVLAKTGFDEQVLLYLERYAPDIPYMVMLHEKDEVSPLLMKRKINYVGAEVIFTNECADVASGSYISYMHGNKLLLWVNAIVYDYRAIMAAGHNDDISVAGRQEDGWGWLISRRYNIIQTDWPLALKCFMSRREIT